MITENEVTEEITYKTLKYEGNIALGYSAGRIGEGEQPSEQDKSKERNMNIKITVESLEKESDNGSQDGILCEDGYAIEFIDLDYLIERIERYLPTSHEYPNGVRIVKLDPADRRGVWGIEKIEE